MPPFIVIDGFTVGSARGFAIGDIVKLFAPDLAADKLPPEVSFKNIWFAYGAKADPAHCIMKGFYLSVEVHLNDPDPGNSADTNPVCGGTAAGNGQVPGDDEESRFCPPSSGSCIAGLRMRITDTGLSIEGSISAFDLGPLSFGDTTIEVVLTKLEQKILFEGSAALYDPVAFYASPEGNRTRNHWGSGYLLIDVGQSLGQFHLLLDGCAIIGGTEEADPECEPSDDALFQASVDGSILADFTQLGMAFFEEAKVDFDLTLTAPALERLIGQVGVQLEPVADWFESAGTAITGTARDVIEQVEEGFCTSFPLNCSSIEVTADAYEDAPVYIESKITATTTAIRDSFLLNLGCFLVPPGGFNLVNCMNGHVNNALTANRNAIAAAGGADYIALHGIDATGYGGSYLGDLEIVAPTRFVWPDGGPANALCGVNGALHGNVICDASPGQIADSDELTALVLLDALTHIDPTLAALFASGELEIGDLPGGATGSPASR